MCSRCSSRSARPEVSLGPGSLGSSFTLAGCCRWLSCEVTRGCGSLLPGQALRPLRADASRGPRPALSFSHATRAQEKGFPWDSSCWPMRFLRVPTPAACARCASRRLVLSPRHGLAHQHSPPLSCADRLPMVPQAKLQPWAPCH